MVNDHLNRISSLDDGLQTRKLTSDMEEVRGMDQKGKPDTAE
jgi:hypothetical protein